MTARKLVAGRVGAFVAMVATVASAYSSPSPEARFVEQIPDTASFPAVGSMLIQACGSLDCHGTVARNLRLYGDTAVRYSPTDVPSTLIPTTADEVAQDYLSVMALEPEIMSEMVASGGASPERLAFLRKACGTEGHKGSAVVVPGDPRDVCITTWLKGRADASACTAALSLS